MRLDPFTSVLIAVVALASFFPCEGQVAVWFGLLTKLAVALLFFCTVPSCRARTCWRASATGDCIWW